VRLLIILILVGVLVIGGCNNQEIEYNNQPIDINNCEYLTKNFDNKIDIILSECENWEYTGKNPIWVGGDLISVSRVYNSAYGRYEHTLTFQGYEKQGGFYINSQSEKIPYQINQFYRFDLSGVCGGRFSAASSGAFYDSDFTALEPISC